MTVQRSRIKDFISDENGSWIMMIAAALVIIAAVMRMAGGEISKGVEAQKAHAIYQQQSNSKKCVSPVVLDAEERNEILIALRNIVTIMSGSQICKT